MLDTHYPTLYRMQMYSRYTIIIQKHCHGVKNFADITNDLKPLTLKLLLDCISQNALLSKPVTGSHQKFFLPESKSDFDIKYLYMESKLDTCRIHDGSEWDFHVQKRC